MSVEADVNSGRPGPKPRVLKAPAVRRAELIDCAQALFLSKGYERTTIADVIDATGLSKGAFYHHFRAKEDLLEAIAARFAAQALAYAEDVRDEPGLDALGRLNRLLAMSREWKEDHLAQLKAMFLTLLEPENARLYHRIVGAVFEALRPAFAGIIAEGQRDGRFDVTDAGLAADALLWMGESRRLLVVRAMSLAETGDVEGASTMIMNRVRAEEAMVDRILGVAPGSVDLAGSLDYVRALVEAWVR